MPKGMKVSAGMRSRKRKVGALVLIGACVSLLFLVKGLKNLDFQFELDGEGLEDCA